MVDKVLDRDELREIENGWTNEESMNKIQENWEKFTEWAGKVGGDRKDKVLAMLDAFGEQACMAPGSSRFEFHNAFPGGLVDHSLRVMNYTVQLAKAWNVKNIKPESIIIATLFHDWGKVGTQGEPYYRHEDSEWHRQRGKIYNKNSKSKMTNAQLGLFTMSQFGIELTEEEYLAILLNDGPYVDENSFYKMKEPQLALLVHFADRWATQCEKGRQSLLDPATPRF